MGACGSKQTLATEPGSPNSKGTAPLRQRGARASMVGNFNPEVSKDAVRVVASEGTVTLPLPAAKCTVRYAYVSQRGYYPDTPDKANQDTVCAIEKVGDQAEAHLFGVFDGHGEFGTECAQFAQAKVPFNLGKERELMSSPAAALHNAMLATNSQLHRSNVDDSLSGTTACVGLVQGSMLHVANVGDSRAVLAERCGDKLVAHDLSTDQTPFRADECARVQRAGARVLTLDQLEGLKDPSTQCWSNEADCDGDPPRLWAPNGMFPGTAFTRSIGDAAAEDIGVFAEPEITSTKLTRSHAFVLLASDGVWEFVSSQRAVDMVARCDNPYDAAKIVVATAYKLWLQRETRTDDISAVVLFLDWNRQSSSSNGERNHSRSRTVSLSATAH